MLPVDISHSKAGHQVERIVAGQPYASLQDLWERARPARPTAERLVEIGALDTVRGALTRRGHRRVVLSARAGMLRPLDQRGTVSWRSPVRTSLQASREWSSTVE
ncbi:hypothetical protein ABT289_05085 [Streptomyces fimicarius]|uniref:hypothetical protein n=1 Tax=Streptomyces griseus TaxID=1911 RepID=UPI00331CDDFA